VRGAGGGTSKQDACSHLAWHLAWHSGCDEVMGMVLGGEAAVALCFALVLTAG